MTIRVTNLTKTFAGASDIVAVRDVSFEVPESKITALLGPSGSGKSTLLRLVAGLEVADSGSISIDGADVVNISPSKRNIGFVFQNYALFGHMTVADNVAFGLKVRKTPAAEAAARADELLDLVQLGGYQHRYPAELSGGQRQRVALARALAPRPRVLLLDEPFGALDTRVRAELRQWLSDLHHQTKVTTILVTHDQTEALELSEHIVLLRDGTVEQAGPPDELYLRPRTSFVASFLGDAQILRGTVKGGVASFARLFNVASRDPDGTPVELFLRPDDVTLASDGPRAEVTQVVRIGPHTRLVVRTDNATTIELRLPRHELTDDLVPGSFVQLRLRDAHPPLHRAQ